MSELWCEHCAVQGLKYRVQHFQVNFDEAILLCENKMCLYPLVSTDCQELLVKRNAAETCNTKRRKRKKDSQQNETKDATTKNKIKIETVTKKPLAPKQDIKQNNAEKEQVQTSYAHWRNESNLCWLHSAMSLLVHNVTLQRLLFASSYAWDSCLRRFSEGYVSAQKAFMQNNRTCDNSVQQLLQSARKHVWDYVHPRMKCESGRSDSPMSALLLLLQSDELVKEKFTQSFRWQFACSKCGYKQVDRFKKSMVTFPNTSEEFRLPDRACFFRPCFRCGEAAQPSAMKFNRLPDCLVLHFEQGLQQQEFWNNEFVFESSQYRVTQFIQYVHNPDHFITWTRNQDRRKWMRMDDLSPENCHWQDSAPDVNPGQAHIVVWEKVAYTQHSSTSTCTSASHITQEQSQSIMAAPIAIPSLSKTNSFKDNTNAGKTAHKLVHSSIKSMPSSHTTVDTGVGPRAESFVVSHRELESNRRKMLSTSALKSGLLPLGQDLVKNVQQKKRKLPPVFQPYIPKSARTAAEDSNPVTPEPTKLLSDASVDRQCDDRTLIEEFQTDSGYSSPGSVSSVSSQGSSSSLSQSLCSQKSVLTDSTDDFLSCLDGMDFAELDDINPTIGQEMSEKDLLDVNQNALMGLDFDKGFADILDKVTNQANLQQDILPERDMLLLS